MKRVILSLAIVALLAGCSSMTIQTDFSDEADFSAFETFKIIDSDRSVASTNPLAHDRILAKIRREMIASGFTEAEGDADVNVTYFAAVRERLVFNTTYTGGAGWGRYGRGRVGMGTATTRATSYEAGTLVIDVWERGRNALIWRGVISDTLSTNPEKNRKKLDRGMARVFEDFPPS